DRFVCCGWAGEADQSFPEHQRAPRGARGAGPSPGHRAGLAPPIHDLRGGRSGLVLRPEGTRRPQHGRDPAQAARGAEHQRHGAQSGGPQRPLRVRRLPLPGHVRRP
ncbi:unnamed protein product, partial [Ectocarpus sp. 13 AM-2016]